MAPLLQWARKLSDRAGLAASQLMLLFATLVLAGAFSETQGADPRVRAASLLQEQGQSFPAPLSARDHRNVEWAVLQSPLQPERHFETKDGDPPAIVTAVPPLPGHTQTRQKRAPYLAAASVSLTGRGARAPPYLV